MANPQYRPVSTNAPTSTILPAIIPEIGFISTLLSLSPFNYDTRIMLNIEVLFITLL